MKIYAVIDTNVIISSMLTRNSDSSTMKVLSYVRDGVIVPMINDDILEEYTDVMAREKFRFTAESVADMLNMFRVRGVCVVPECLTIDFIDPNDVIFYQTYRLRQDSYLVTGNQRHFPSEARIVSPADMVDILLLMNEGQGGLLNDMSVEYMSEEKRAQLQRAWEAFESLRASAAASGTSDMSMEEIDEEIRLYREERQARVSQLF